ncbi:probable G-protein coupled receptor 139 [Heterodontus francisci]|uniref:probable G-protein coupled receptor 139 n=1 Tax=Heterodontus francisci TaxID=7792 RepID=UPI00355C8265
MVSKLGTVDLNITSTDQNLKTVDWNITSMGRSFSLEFDYLPRYHGTHSLETWLLNTFLIIQSIYFPILVIVGVPVNLVTIVVLSRKKCGLSKCVTQYLVAMAAADLLVIILDLMLRQIPIVFREQLLFMWNLRVCNIHAVLLYAATDCSVWFTVTFTFDRFVVICCQKLKSKYCNEKTAPVVLGTVTVLSCLNNIFWYFMFRNEYMMLILPWFCFVTQEVAQSRMWAIIETLHHILTPCVPFVLVLLLNALTVKCILVTSRARWKLRSHNNGYSPRDPEMESRRKSIILLFAISGNFILLWAMFMVYSIWIRMWSMRDQSVYIPFYVQQMGVMLQLLSCCTNTCIYAVAQTKFREQLKNVVKYAFAVIVRFMK